MTPQSKHDAVGTSREFFARDLDRFGDAIAVVTDAGMSLSYADLARSADAFSASLGGRRCLLLIEASNHIEPLVAYIGALRGGHPVILAAAGADQTRLCSTFAPDARYAQDAEGWKLSLETSPKGTLHPDLAVLLSTSGTTGATKLIRLSEGAINANAGSIAQYLEIGCADRAITSLPFHYSYGLSVVNSHLSSGATLLLTDRSVVDPEFWAFFQDQKATSLAGVPYTYDLLERVGFFSRSLPTLRTLTQAGGRLQPAAVTRTALWSRDRDIRFFVMYGQTEATARMAYLPPDQALAHPESIGQVIPGGAFNLLGTDGQVIEAVDTVGELVYRGPNVMMGYATQREDLARGPELEELHTGDLARRGPDGLYRIVGRKSRFAKIFGLRIGLDEVEAALGERGWVSAAVSDDTEIFIALRRDQDSGSVAQELGDRYGLPSSVFNVSYWDDLPTLVSGKIDYQAILRAGQAEASAAAASRHDDNRHPIEVAYAQAFPRAIVGLGDSFVSLGGDSLNYVTLSITIEDVLGVLPEAWEQLSVGELCETTSQRRSKRWWSLRTLETEVVLRMLAILAVVVNHASSLVVGGGAEVLMILAGYNLGRYQKGRLIAGQGFTVASAFAQRIMVPYYLILVAYLIAKWKFDVPSLLLVSNFFGRFGSLIEPFWFLEAMFQCFVIVALLDLIPPVRRAIAADGWRFGIMALAATVALKCAAFLAFHHGYLANRTPDAALYLLALGWCLNEATTRERRVAMTVVLGVLAVIELVGLPGVWTTYPEPSNIAHAIWLSLCAVGLLWMRRLPLPDFAHRGVAAVAAASFYIYLTHVVVLWVIYWHLGYHGLALNLATSIALGIGAWWAAEWFAKWRGPKRAAGVG